MSVTITSKSKKKKVDDHFFTVLAKNLLTSGYFDKLKISYKVFSKKKEIWKHDILDMYIEINIIISDMVLLLVCIVKIK